MSHTIDGPAPSLTNTPTRLDRAPARVQEQIDLFGDVLQAYAATPRQTNMQLYKTLAARSDIPKEAWEEKTPIGQGAVLYNPLKLRVRWYQNTLKKLGLLVNGEVRGEWQLTPAGQDKLTSAKANTVLLGFSTELGVALWSRCESAFPSLDEPIMLCLSSLPYPLKNPRDYGNPSEAEYVDWVCGVIEPIVRNLDPRGSIVLNVGNDIFEKGLPSRSLYRERMVLALCDRFGLHKMDEIIWHNPARPPGPLRWASVTRQQLNAAYEVFYWFSPDPAVCKANNRRILQPHTQQHLKLIQGGGERRSTSYGDGAHRVRPGSYGNETEGRIQRNVIAMTHNCSDKRELARMVKAAGLPVHGATMPLKLAQLIIEFMTEKQDLVVDPCAGWFRTAKAAQELNRRWFVTEKEGEYVLGGGLAFRKFAGFQAFGRLAA